MMRKTFLVSATVLLLLAFGFIKAYAGWYECYNFSGTIDQSPITLSIQRKDGFFGESAKKDFNLHGVYKYDKNNQSIRLEGIWNTSNNRIVLYEGTGKKRTAAFEFEFSENEPAGFWTNLSTNQKLPLNLKYVSKLLDTENDYEFADVEILQANSLKDFYFIGVYSKVKNVNDAEMKRLKIIRKKDNSLFQTLNFPIAKAPTGNLMTIIYDNVEMPDKSTNFIVSNKLGRIGGYWEVNYNLKKKKFVLNPKPKAEGPQ